MNQFRKNTRFKIIHYLRYLRLIGLVKKCGKVWIDKNVRFIRNPRNIVLGDLVYIKSNTIICSCNVDAIIKIGNNVSIGYNNLIFSSQSISIGDNVMIAPNVHILDSNHGYKSGQLMDSQENETNPVVIEDDVWIGSGCIILAGSFISKGSIIAANSVVNGFIGKNEIWGGSPAKKIKDRF